MEDRAYLQEWPQNKVRQDRKSTVERTPQIDQEQLALLGVKLNQYSNELAMQDINMAADKLQSADHGHHYERPHNSSLKFHNNHRRIKSRSET